MTTPDLRYIGLRRRPLIERLYLLYASYRSIGFGPLRAARAALSMALV